MARAEVHQKPEIDALLRALRNNNETEIDVCDAYVPSLGISGHLEQLRRPS